MLKSGKLATLRTLKWLGAYSAARCSAWRRAKLLILCYHGISIEDEHEWDPRLYLPPSRLRERLEMIRRLEYDVLPLEEGLRRLTEGTLARPSVVLTFDDGTYDFYARAYPLIREYKMPATVYLTSYYCANNKPVFGMFCSYLLWKARGRRLLARPLTGEDKEYDLRTEESRIAAVIDLHLFAEKRALSGDEKNCLAAKISEQVGVDFAAVTAKRLVHIMNAGELAEIAAGGVDIQLHTHRHRVPLDRELFTKEIQDNRAFIERITGRPARHFCYPSGRCNPEFPGWLRALGVSSATTCEPGIVSRNTNALLLPRLVETSSLTDIEMEGWLTGVASFLPRRTA